MEKFSRWRDAGTGIQPFLPPVPARQNTSTLESLLSVFSMVIKPVLGLAKLLVVAVVSMIMFIFVDGIGSLLAPLPPLHRAYRRLFLSVFARLLLMLLGFVWIKTETVTLRRGRSAGAAASASKKASGKKAFPWGQIIVSNWTSYIDVLYLAFRYDPVFTQIYPETLTVREVSMWKAMELSGSYPELAPPQGVQAYPLIDFLKNTQQKGRGPVVIFAEGTTSNNRALLKFVPLFRKFQIPETNVDINILAFKYEYQKFCPTITVRFDRKAQVGHMLRTCAQFYNQLTVKSLAAEERPSNAHFSTLSGLASTPSGLAAGVVESVTDEDALGSVIQNLMGQISRLRKTGLGVQDKADFLDFYVQRNYGVQPGANNAAATKRGGSSSRTLASSTKKRS
ncbi:hypothetical protein BGZ73_005463 [Actinomortierella ambigua]|nr:hypothetical protein BGZ73_005463 [Actinomortierella ambigua]